MKPMRCISWVAVSTKPQYEKESPEEQRRENKRIIDDIGGVLVAELVVPGQSRTIISMEDAARQLDAYADLLKLIDDRAADLLVFRDFTRLGRTASLGMQVAQTCLEAGVALYDRTSPPYSLSAADQRDDDGLLLVRSIHASNSQLDVRRLVRYRRHGMIGRVKDGRHPGKVPYGFERVADAQTGEWQLVQVPQQADVVRRVFSEYVDAGKSLRTISNELNVDGVPGPSGGRWYARTVHRLIGRVWVYAGYVEFYDKKGDGDLHRYPGLHEGIISVDEARAVSRESMVRQGAPRAVGTKLFSRVLVCGKCGRWLVSTGKTNVKGFTVYRCNYVEYENDSTCERSQVERHKNCAGSRISEDKLIEAVQAAVDWARDGFNLSKVVDDVPREAQSFSADIQVLESSLLQAQQERERVVYMAQRDIISIDDAEQKTRDIDKRIARLRRQVDELRANSDGIESRTERFERILAALKRFDKMLDSMPTAEANALLRATFQITIKDRAVESVRFV